MKSYLPWRGLLLVPGLIAVMVVPLLCLSCTTVTNEWPAGNKPKVLVSFAPLYCFALNVAGDDATLKTLLTNRGPHDYPYDARDLVKVRGADLYLVNGLSLDEDFSLKLAKNSGNIHLKLVELADIAIPKDDRLQLNVDHGDHSHSGDDPHVWLGLPEAQKMVAQIAKELGAIDPAHKDDYDRRANEYIAKLKALHEEGKKALSAKPEEQRIITTHDAFQYFARAFGVEIVGYIQPRAGVGIDSKDLKKLVDDCKGKEVSVITTEPQFPPDSAITLLKGVSSKLAGQPKPILAELDPLETSDGEPDEGWYERKMKQNIDTLVEAFKKFREQK